MDMDMYVYKDGEIYRHLYYGSEDSPLEDPSPYHITKISNLPPSTANGNSAFNVLATTTPDDSATYDEYETFFEDNELSSLLRLAGRSQYILPSTSSSMSSSSSLFSPRSYSRSPFSDNVHSPPVKMEFNEDVLVMDGILLNQLSSNRSSRSSFLSGSSSCSSSGANYCSFGCGGICKCSFLHHRTQNKLPFVVSGRKKGGGVPDGRAQSPKGSVPSRGDLNGAEGTVVSPPNRNNTSTGASEDTVSTPCKIRGVRGDASSSSSSSSAGNSSSAKTSKCSSTMKSKNHTKKEDPDAISNLKNDGGSRSDGIEPMVALEVEISKKSEEVVYAENIPKRGKRLPIFDEIAPS